MPQHHPKVEIIWEIWPFNVIFWAPVREFIQGHGLNILFNILYNFLSTYINIWNFVTGIVFWWFNLAWYILNFLPNLIFGTISDIIFFIPEVLVWLFNFAWGLLSALPFIIYYAIVIVYVLFVGAFSIIPAVFFFTLFFGFVFVIFIPMAIIGAIVAIVGVATG